MILVVAAQLRPSSGRNSKVLNGHTRIETVVEMVGVSRLVLYVDIAGDHSRQTCLGAAKIGAAIWLQSAW
jgi:hypothetical protein